MTSAETVAVAAAVAEAHGPLDDAPPDAVDLDATPDAASLALPSATASTGRAEAPVPPRLAVPAWLHALATPAGRTSVRVALAEGGSVRLDTVREADAVTVRVQFSDPELQALAGAHASRIRDALEAHFSEPVRLQFNDTGAHAGPHSGGEDAADRGARRPSASSGTDGAAPEAASPDPPPPIARTAAGRREWIG
ncbi:hypothetical protein [Rubrivirga marina]|uniref:Uncharacterized protein n=1 Tax=Rubrivirga marina TaxID=1196024 RepID=A0A271IX23_9BACT|nr:hypothetical protein [Rubrivirga marina]PAP75763.1 hypothetical protein BSZ37_04570 [Rubrivirga marina]